MEIHSLGLKGHKDGVSVVREMLIGRGSQQDPRHVSSKGKESNGAGTIPDSKVVVCWEWFGKPGM